MENTCAASRWRQSTDAELAWSAGVTAPNGAGSRALFLDRDGVINEEAGYLHRFEDVRFVDGIVPLLQTANRLGWFTCVVTNQAGIGRGLYSEQQFHDLMQAMRAALAEQEARLDAVYFSPFHPEHGLGEYRRDSDCRKPKPGMLLRAAEEHGLDLSRSAMVGDRCSDMQAGAAAGVPELYLLRGLEREVCSQITCDFVDSLAQVNLRLFSFRGV